MSELSLRHIYKMYDNTLTKKEMKAMEKSGVDTKQKYAVNDFCLDVKDKEFVVFVGPSGCGKSTTLRMIAGLEEITDGELYIDGELMNDVEPKNRNIAMVFQNYALYPHMTVYDNMAFSLKIRKLPKAEIDKRVRDAAKLLDITEYLARKPKALSGGQRQRVAIGRAIVRSPKVFLMDEPLSNLDAKLRHQMRSELILLRKKINSTFIYVTHDQVEAMTLGDRVVVMKDGFIQQTGTPSEVFNKPSNLFVAGFIGTPHMNFMDAKLVKEEGHYYVLLEGIKLPLSKDYEKVLNDNNVSNKEIVLGLRPEHIEISSKSDLKVVANVSEMMGSELQVHSSFKDSDKDIIIRVPLIGTDEKLINVINDGGEVGIAFKQEAMHLFDKETEKNLIF